MLVWSTVGRPSSVSALLFPITSANTANGRWGEGSRCAGGLIGPISWGIAALPVPKHALMCFNPLPIEAWYPPKEFGRQMACNNDIMRGMRHLQELLIQVTQVPFSQRRNCQILHPDSSLLFTSLESLQERTMLRRSSN